jgi:hypothetical protein
MQHQYAQMQQYQQMQALQYQMALANLGGASETGTPSSFAGLGLGGGDGGAGGAGAGSVGPVHPGMAYPYPVYTAEQVQAMLAQAQGGAYPSGPPVSHCSSMQGAPRLLFFGSLSFLFL